jgi:hypothetical protein
MLRHVALVRTDVSEELSVSFIRVTIIGEVGTTLAATRNRSTLHTETTKRGDSKSGMATLESFVILLASSIWKRGQSRMSVGSECHGYFPDKFGQTNGIQKKVRN